MIWTNLFWNQRTLCKLLVCRKTLPLSYFVRRFFYGGGVSLPPPAGIELGLLLQISFPSNSFYLPYIQYIYIHYTRDKDIIKNETIAIVISILSGISFISQSRNIWQPVANLLIFCQRENRGGIEPAKIKLRNNLRFHHKTNWKYLFLTEVNVPSTFKGQIGL